MAYFLTDPLIYTPRTWPIASVGDFTLITIPDTQIAARDYPYNYISQARWIAHNHATLGGRLVLHLGDTVNDPGTPLQWARSNAALDLIDASDVPLLILAGNHDYDDLDNKVATTFNATYPPTRYASAAWFDGQLKDDNAAQNFYVIFGDWLLLALEYGPTPDTLAWARSILDTHTSERVIIATHSYLRPDGTRNSVGDAVWNGLAKLYANVELIFCGHLYDNPAYVTDTGDEANTVHQILSDFEGTLRGGEGYLRIYRFASGENKLYVETFSPTINTWLTDAANEFVIDLAT